MEGTAQGYQRHMETTIRLLIKDSEEISREIKLIISSIFPGFDFSTFDAALSYVKRLFSGQINGFRQCDTPYHDWDHTMGVILATARLLHGVHVDRQEFSERTANLVLVAALFHDTGYICRDSEGTGSGGRFTKDHVQRGIDLLEEYSTRQAWPPADALDLESMLLCTDPARNTDTIVFMNIGAMIAAHTLATADIISQMADDIYLEKLPLLFMELREAGITDFTSEYDLFMKTLGFYTFMQAKMEGRLSNVISCMSAHFRKLNGVDRDFYSEAVRKNMDYLISILEKYGQEYHKGLRRNLTRNEIPITIAA